VRTMLGGERFDRGRAQAWIDRNADALRGDAPTATASKPWPRSRFAERAGARSGAQDNRQHGRCRGRRAEEARVRMPSLRPTADDPADAGARASHSGSVSTLFRRAMSGSCRSIQAPTAVVHPQRPMRRRMAGCGVKGFCGPASAAQNTRSGHAGGAVSVCGRSSGARSPPTSTSVRHRIAKAPWAATTTSALAAVSSPELDGTPALGHWQFHALLQASGRCPTDLDRVYPQPGRPEGQRWPVVRARGCVKCLNGPSANPARPSRQP
jgi:hypothetical protein